MSRRIDPGIYFRTPNLPVRFIENKRLSAVISLAEIEKKHSVLDVGCGTGELLARIDAREKVGVDLSEKMLGAARANLPRETILKRMAAENMDLPDGCFDRICCSEVLEHLPDPHSALTEISRVLNQAGIVSVSIPNENFIKKIKFLARFFGLSKWLFRLGGQNMTPRNDWHLHDASVKRFREWNGDLFRIYRIKAVPFRFFPVHYVFQLRKR